MILSWIIIIIIIAIATATILLTTPIQHKKSFGYAGMWIWVIGLGYPTFRKILHPSPSRVKSSWTAWPFKIKALGSSATPRPTHPKTQYRVHRTLNSKLHCCMSKHVEDEALYASHCNDTDQHMSCTDRQTFWITNLADKTDKVLRPCVQFRPTVLSATVLIALIVSAGGVNRNVP